MQLRFIGQGYRNDNSNVASELISSLQNTQYDSFECMVAFASFGGVSALTPHVSAASHISNFNIVVGIDNMGTSKEALEELIHWGVSVKVYHSLSPIIFHPKIYVFRGPNEGKIIIGSNNLTEMGLAKNIEASMVIEAVLPIDNAAFDEIENYFEDILNGTDTNVQTLTNALIARLVSTGKIPTDSNRSKSHDRKYGTSSTTSSANIASIFSTSHINSNPAGFTPKRIVRRSSTGGSSGTGSTAPTTATVFSTDNENWVGEANNSVLVAEIGGPGRWKQVNFPVEMFQNFFGATPGDNGYHIRLRHVSNSSELGDIEDTRAVTVASQNYRFELNSATGTYPTGGRPIGIYIRVAERNFLYHIVMPSDANYTEVNAFLLANYSGPSRNLNRIETDAETLFRNCPNLPF